MTVTAGQIAKAKAEGLRNVEAIAAACDKTGAKLYLACAMIAKESFGKNVYGSDVGGVLRGFKDEVNEANFRAFEHEVLVNKRTSNGVGICQITYGGFFTQMRGEGLKAWLPADNAYFGIRLLWQYYLDGREQGKSNSDAIVYAGRKYNGAQAYGEDLLIQARRWLKIVGSDDYN